ncbi:MAG: hypothetical protein ACI976_000234, partial [Aureispira sp.]
PITYDFLLKTYDQKSTAMKKKKSRLWQKLSKNLFFYNKRK